MARAIRLAVEAGALARGAGRIPRRRYAEASTPEEGLPVFDHPSRRMTRRRADRRLGGGLVGQGPDGVRRAAARPTIHYEDPLTAEPLEGLEELGRHAARLWAAFPDARLERTGAAAARRTASSPRRASCSPPTASRSRACPATNRFIVVHCVFYCELERRAVCCRVRGFFDLYDAAVQLGVLPGRGTLGEKALLVLRGFGLRAGAAAPPSAWRERPEDVLDPVLGMSAESPRLPRRGRNRPVIVIAASCRAR